MAGFGSAFAEGAGTGIASSLVGRFSDRIGDSVFGIPGPSGRESGEFARDYFNAAFPGTNPWERLGTSTPASSMVAADAQQRNVARQITSNNIINRAQMRTQRDIVDKQTGIQDEVSRRDLAGKIITAEATENAARIAAGGQQSVAGIGADVKLQAAEIAAGATEYAADTGADATKYAARHQYSAAQVGAGAAEYAADVAAAASRYKTDAEAITNRALQSAQFNKLVAETDMTRERVVEIAANIAYIKANEKQVFAAIGRINAQTRRELANATLDEARAILATEFAEAGLTREQTANIFAFTANADKHPVAFATLAAAAAVGSYKGLVRPSRTSTVRTDSRKGGVRTQTITNDYLYKPAMGVLRSIMPGWRK